jgi:hypothetical protein
MHLTGSLSAAEPVAREAIELLEPSGDVEALARALATLAEIQYLPSGEIPVHLLDRALTLEDEADFHNVRVTEPTWVIWCIRKATEESATKRLNLLVSAAAVGTAAASAAFAGPSAPARISCRLAETPKVAFRVPLARAPTHLVAADRTLWITLAGRHNPRTGATLAGGSVVAVDQDSGRILRRVRLPVDPTEFAAAFGSLWVIGASNDRRFDGVLRVDPRSGRVLAVIRASRAYGSRITATAKAIWVGGADVYPKGHSDRAGVRFVYRIDPRRNAVVQRVRLPQGMTVLDLDGEGSSLWVSGWWGVARISNGGRTLFHEPFAGAGWSMAATSRAVWVSLPWFGTPYQRRQDPAHRARQILRIERDARRPRVRVIDLPEQPGGVAAAAGTVWMGAGLQGLARIDDTKAPPVVAPTGIDVVPTYIVPFRGGVWVAEATKNRVTKVIC